MLLKGGSFLGPFLRTGDLCSGHSGLLGNSTHNGFEGFTFLAEIYRASSSNGWITARCPLRVEHLLCYQGLYIFNEKINLNLTNIGGIYYPSLPYEAKSIVLISMRSTSLFMPNLVSYPAMH